MMQAELEADLDYAKNDSKNKTTDNSRNGTSFKTLLSDLGEIEIDVPRDRDSEDDFITRYPLPVTRYPLSVSRYPLVVICYLNR